MQGPPRAIYSCSACQKHGETFFLYRCQAEFEFSCASPNSKLLNLILGLTAVSAFMLAAVPAKTLNGSSSSPFRVPVGDVHYCVRGKLCVSQGGIIPVLRLQSSKYLSLSGCELRTLSSGVWAIARRCPRNCHGFLFIDFLTPLQRLRNCIQLQVDFPVQSGRVQRTGSKTRH